MDVSYEILICIWIRNRTYQISQHIPIFQLNFLFSSNKTTKQHLENHQLACLTRILCTYSKVQRGDNPDDTMWRSVGPNSVFSSTPLFVDSKSICK